MRSWAILLLVSLPALAEPPGLGESLPAAEVAAVDFTVLPDGTGLPEGRGSVAEGEVLYGQHCLACHGEGGEGGANDRLAGGVGSIGTDRPLKTVGSYWPYATTVFDYVRRAMPYNAPGTLTSDEVYALTAYLLHLNGILDAEAVMDAGSLPAVSMPNREGFVWAVPAD